MDTLKGAARAKSRLIKPATNMSSLIKSVVNKPSALASDPSLHAFAVNKPVLIGSSIGGTQALELVLTALPADTPHIAITQHTPDKFTAMYADRLNGLCAICVREAEDGDRLERGVALIASGGGRHMQLRKAASQYFVTAADGPPVNRHKPTVDVLFRFAAEVAESDILGISLMRALEQVGYAKAMGYVKLAPCSQLPPNRPSA